MIGADSVLFHEFIKNQTSFDFGVAERVEILIKFDPQSGVPKQINSFYLICEDTNEDKVVVKYKFAIQQHQEEGDEGEDEDEI